MNFYVAFLFFEIVYYQGIKRTYVLQNGLHYYLSSEILSLVALVSSKLSSGFGSDDVDGASFSLSESSISELKAS